MPRSLATGSIIAAFFLLYSIGAVSQERPTGPWVFKLDGGAASQSKVDLKDSNGGFGVDRWFMSAGADYGWSRRDSVGISFGGGVSKYNFSEGTQLGDKEPWSNIEESRVSLTGRFGFGETGSLIIIPTLRQNGEKGASSSDSQTYGLLTAAFWRISDTLMIGPGLGVFSRLEDSTRAFPILAIDWKISDKWNLSTGRGLAASQGPGLTLNYQHNPAWSFGLAARYEDIEFRLDDQGVAPGGVGRDKSLPLVLSARFTPNPGVSLSAFLGTKMGGNLALKNQFGNTLEESDYEPAALIGATFDIRL